MARQFREQLEEEVELENARKAQRANNPPPPPPFDPVPANPAPGEANIEAAAERAANPVPPPIHGPTMPAPTMPEPAEPVTPEPAAHADNPGDETGAKPAGRQSGPPSADERGT